MKTLTDNIAVATKHALPWQILMATTVDSPILIVGAGIFGLSTAFHLLDRGYKIVTVIDRSPVLPAPDAASTDKNKSKRHATSEAFLVD